MRDKIRAELALNGVAAVRTLRYASRRWWPEEIGNLTSQGYISVGNSKCLWGISRAGWLIALLSSNTLRQ